MLLALLLTLPAFATPAAPIGTPPIDTAPQEDPFLEDVTHGYVQNDGVRLHFAELGEGPLVVLLHGFPDYWYTWRDVMVELASDHRVVALDLRGYNRSDKPEGVENYAMGLLLSDVDAVIRHFGAERATVIGHDWGGAIAWQFAAWYPQRVERLGILNMTHPTCYARELANPETQGGSSQYGYDLQAEDAHLAWTPERLAGWVTDPSARPHYVAAFGRSDVKAMLHYYRANFPKRPGGQAAPAAFPRIKVPVLVIFGLKDRYVLAAGLNDTWKHLDGDLTLVTAPDAGHFVQQDEPELVTRSLGAWLRR